MRIATVVVGALLVAAGGVWIFQGIGSLKGSFMTGSPFWAWVGIACVIVGGAILVRAALKTRR